MTEGSGKTDIVAVDLTAGGAACATARGDGFERIDRLYLDCRRTLHPVLTRRLGSRAEADDVLQEAFLRFLGTYVGRSIANPLGLLARIATNIVRDGARKASVRRRLLEESDALPCGGLSPPTPESELSGRQDLQRLKDAIDALPPRCREVFLLHRLEGLPHSEVAKILGISRSAVEKHMIRAQGQLRALLDPTGLPGVDRREEAGT